MSWNTQIFLLIVAGLAVTTGSAVNKTDEDVARMKKALGIFSVIRFPNSLCVGSAGLNGTCYTAEECSAKSGSSDGACASGFGVCCTISLACGSSTSENCTYHTITTYSTATDASPCDYEVCRSSSDICKLRVDFMTFTIAPPQTPLVAQFAAAAGIINLLNPDVSAGETYGDCSTDTFSISSPGNQGPPVICGKNAGHHVYVDISDSCAIMSFNIDKGTTFSRQWSLKVSQVECTNRLADHECLQYHTGTSGTFMSFNFDPSTTSTSDILPGDNYQHLSDQYYSICFRREEGYCGICFSPLKAGTNCPATEGSFGVAASAGAIAAKGGNEIQCTGVIGGLYADYIEVNGLIGAPPVPTAVSASISTIGNPPEPAAGENYATKTCGSYFGVNSDAPAIGGLVTADVTACSYKIPFIWGVNFDSGEVATTCAAIAINTCEQAFVAGWQAAATALPTGMVGFSMTYFQTTCT